MSATATDAHSVDISWTAATDNTGVESYEIYRNGALLATIGPETSYTDLTVAAEVTYWYQIMARDPAGNVITVEQHRERHSSAGPGGPVYR